MNRELFWAATILYGLLSGASIAADLLGWVSLRFWPVSYELGLVGFGGSTLLAVCVVGLSVVFVRKFEWARRLQQLFVEVMGKISVPWIFYLAAVSSVGEELFFRGVLQQIIGFWPTALLFGLLHGFFKKELWQWTLFALVMGVLFGIIVDFGMGLGASIWLHFLVNSGNLLFLSLSQRT